MKSILVGKLDNKKVYFVVDSIDNKSDCVLVNESGQKQVCNFWETVDNNPRIHKIFNSKFHEYLWNGHHSKTSAHWYSLFVDKAVPVDGHILKGVQINDDVLKRRPKMLAYENRAMEFGLAIKTQTMSQPMLENWFDGPARKIKRKPRMKKSFDEQ